MPGDPSAGTEWEPGAGADVYAASDGFEWD